MDTDFAANSILVAIKKDDIINMSKESPAFSLEPVPSGLISGEAGENAKYYLNRIVTPRAGEYIIRATVKSPEAKPEVYIGVNQ